VRGGGALVPATALGVDAARFERLRVPLDDAGLGPLGQRPHLPAGEAAGALADVARTARAAVLVPARHQDTLHGVIAVGGKLSDEGFSAPDLEFLAAAAGQLAFGLASVETRGQRRELDEAREIQASLLPACLPEAPGVGLAAHWQPAKQVAGDYYDAFPLDGGRLAVCVADVTGKGMPAALLMSNLQATVKAFAPSMGSPAALCARVNRVLSAQITLGRFITFFYAELETGGRALRYANAGHNPPLLLRAGGAAEWLDAGGPLLGVVPDAGYEEATTALAPGDTLVLYTDGITEAQAATGELFGEERLLASVRAAAGGGPEAVQRRLLDDVAAHCGGDWGDDATVLVLRAT
jgi:sigma-B regulation protein RsbU (phosphoserine phosphatase)